MSQPLVTSTEVEVRYAETDQMGVVHHSAYVVWFELARTHLCVATGFHYAEIERLGYQLTVARIEAAYRRPARYGDTVTVDAWIARLGSRGVRFAYAVRRGEERLADGASEHVWIEAASGRPCRMPELLREPFRRAAGLDPDAEPEPAD